MPNLSKRLARCCLTAAWVITSSSAIAPRRRGLGEHVAVEQRAAEGDQDVAFARRQPWRSVLGLGLGAAGAQGIPEDEAGLAHPDLVTVAQPMRGPDSLAVDPRAVGGAEVGHAPARREPLEDRVEVAGHGIVLESDVVLSRLADGRPVGLEREPPAAGAGHHLDLRVHAAKPTDHRSPTAAGSAWAGASGKAPWCHSWFHVERIWADLRAPERSCYAATDLR